MYLRLRFSWFKDYYNIGNGLFHNTPPKTVLCNKQKKKFLSWYVYLLDSTNCKKNELLFPYNVVDTGRELGGLWLKSPHPKNI